MSTSTVKWWIVRISLFIITVGMAGIALAQTSKSVQPIQTSANNKIEAGLATKLAAGSADYIVKFKEQADLTPAYKMGWDARGQFVYDTLRADR